MEGERHSPAFSELRAPEGELTRPDPLLEPPKSEEPETSEIDQLKVPSIQDPTWTQAHHLWDRMQTPKPSFPLSFLSYAGKV